MVIDFGEGVLRAVQVIADSVNAEAFSEPVVVIIMAPRRLGRQWQVVATVGDACADGYYNHPQPNCYHVTGHDCGTGHCWQDVDKHVFYGMAICGGQGERGRPFVVLLVNVFVDGAVV